MKSKRFGPVFAGLLLCAAVIPAAAREISAEEKSLAAVSGELDKIAAAPGGHQRVAQRIKAQFGVEGTLVMSLRSRLLGYGEIAIAFGLAQEMRGGIKDANLHKIVALRQGPPVTGWGKIAGDLGLKLGPVQSKVRKIVADVHNQEKANLTQKAGIAAKTKDQKSAKTERPGKTEKEAMKSMMRP